MSRSPLAALAALALAGAPPALAQGPAPLPSTIQVAPGKAAPPASDKEVLRAVGLSLAGQLKVFDLSAKELDLVIAGLRDGLAGKGKEDLAKGAPHIGALARTRRDAHFKRTQPKGSAALAFAAAEPGAVKLDSGMVFRPLVEGTGAPGAGAPKVKLSYETRLADGPVVDSSEKRGGPVTVMTAAVARCWAEGLQRLKVGGKARVTCPPWTAFGAEGAGPIPADATIVSELELVEVVKE